MKKLMSVFSVMAVLVMVAGCASVSKEDCLVTDWYELGRADGRMGKNRTALQGRAKACLEHGISADRQAYYAGHGQGLKSYCTEQNGFDLGQKGLPFNTVCPLQLDAGFRAGYDKGIRYYCSESKGYELGYQGKAYRYVCPPELEPEFRAGYEKGRELYQYEAELASLHRQLKNIERKTREKEKQLYAANLTDAQRSQIRAELRDLDLRYRDVSRELKYLEVHTPE